MIWAKHTFKLLHNIMKELSVWRNPNESNLTNLYPSEMNKIQEKHKQFAQVLQKPASEANAVHRCAVISESGNASRRRDANIGFHAQLAEQGWFFVISRYVEPIPPPR